MAPVKLGSKFDVFYKEGQAWFCSNGLPSDVVLVVEETSFHLHKFPLISKSGLIERLIGEAPSEEEKSRAVIKLPDIPGGAKAFELVAKFCYSIKLEITASNAIFLRCAAQHLQMTPDFAGEGNLLSLVDSFLNHVVFHSWKDSLTALQSCKELVEQPHADDHEYNLAVKRCIDSLASKAACVTDPNLLQKWPVQLQSPGGSVLWNGINTGAKPMSSSADWWYADTSSLSLNLYLKLISAIQSRGISQEISIGSLVHYAKKHLPGITRRHSSELGSRLLAPIADFTLTEEEQKHLIEEIDRLIPMEKGVIAPQSFLLGLLRTGIILHVSSSCMKSLEEKIGMQLHQAALEDLLIPNFGYSMETLYNVDCVHRILEHFLAYHNQEHGGASPCSFEDGATQLGSSPNSLAAPMTLVAMLIDGYLSEVAPDINLKPTKFHSLAAAVPHYARPFDDGLYRAIDIYLKTHPRLTDSEKEELSRLLDCQKLSFEACAHAAQNERLALRMVVQILFFEQLQLRATIAENLEAESRPMLRTGTGATLDQNQELKVRMDEMRMRVCELEKECSVLKQAIEKVGNRRGRGGAWLISSSKRLMFRMKAHICNADEAEKRKVEGELLGDGKAKNIGQTQEQSI